MYVLFLIFVCTIIIWNKQKQHWYNTELYQYESITHSIVTLRRSVKEICDVTLASVMVVVQKHWPFSFLNQFLPHQSTITKTLQWMVKISQCLGNIMSLNESECCGHNSNPTRWFCFALTNNFTQPAFYTDHGHTRNTNALCNP